MNVRTVLYNPKYVGRWVWGATKLVRDGEGELRQVAAEKERHVVLERLDLRIVSDELWDVVQTRRALIVANLEATNPRFLHAAVPHPRHRNPLYNLQGIVRCGECGGPMHSCTQGYGRILVCSNHREGSCPMNHEVRLDQLEPAFAQAMAQLCEQVPGWLAEVKTAMVREIQLAQSRNPSAIESLQSHLKEIRQQIDNLVGDRADGKTARSIVQRIEQLEREEDEAQAQLKVLAKSKSSLRQIPTDGQFRQALRDFAKALAIPTPAMNAVMAQIIEEASVVHQMRVFRSRPYLQLKLKLAVPELIKHVAGLDGCEQQTYDVGETQSHHLLITMTPPTKLEAAGPRISELRAQGMTFPQISRLVALDRTSCVNALKLYHMNQAA